MSSKPSTSKPDAPTPIRPVQADAARRQLAEKNRKEFQARISGASARGSYLSRDLIKTLPFSAAVLMVTKIINGDLEPKTAMEAAQVAKALVDIGRLEVGEAAPAQIELTADERQTRVEAAKKLEASIRKRRKELEREADGIENPQADSDPASTEREAESA